MLRRLLFPIALLAVALAAVGSGYAGTRAAPKLVGVSGPGFTISVKTAAGKAVKTLKTGKYTIKVEDKSSLHNFHLFGPGVNKKTSVSGTGTQTWTVTLKPGKYTYQCDIHAATGMKGSFKVTM
jgi:Copper binding proteins, plastocyanin/azurin family